jgi:hypothetical protein
MPFCVHSASGAFGVKTAYSIFRKAYPVFLATSPVGSFAGSACGYSQVVGNHCRIVVIQPGIGEGTLPANA